MSEQAVALAKEFFDTLDRHDWDGALAMMHPEHRFYFPAVPEPLDAAGHAAFTADFVKSFPDFRHLIAEQFAADDHTVVTRGLIHVTHEGDFQGIPPSGVTTEFGFINIMRVVDDLVHEERVELNLAGLMNAIRPLPDAA